MSGVPVDSQGLVHVTIAEITAAIVSGLLGVSVRQSVYRDQIPITCDDTNAHDFALCDAIYVVTGGDLTYINEAGDTRTATVLSGSIWPCSATRVKTTGTSAGTQTGLMAFYYEVQ